MKINWLVVFMVPIFIGTCDVANCSIQEVKVALANLQGELGRFNNTLNGLHDALEGLKSKVDEIRLLPRDESGFNSFQGEAGTFFGGTSGLGNSPLERALASAEQAFADLVASCQPQQKPGQSLENFNEEKLLYEVHEQPANYIFPKIKGKALEDFTEADIDNFEYITSGDGRNDTNTFVLLERIYANHSLDSVRVVNQKNEYDFISQNPVYSLNTSEKWAEIAKIIDELRWCINKNEILKILIFKKVLTNFHCPYDMQPLNILFFQNGYREASIVRLATASVLWYCGYYCPNFKKKRYSIMANACLLQLINIIYETHDNMVLHAIEVECNDYIKAKEDLKKNDVGFDVWGVTCLDGTFKRMKLGHTIAYSSEGEIAKQSLLRAIALRREIDSLKEQIAASKGRKAKEALEKKRKEEEEQETIKKLKWQDAQAAKQAEEEAARKKEQETVKQKLDDEANEAINSNSSDSGNNNKKNTKGWTATYVASQIRPWENKDISKNIIAECGGEWDFAKKLQTYCDKPEEIGDQLDNVKDILTKVIPNILKSKSTLQVLCVVGRNESDRLAKATLIHMLARIIKDLELEYFNLVYSLPVVNFPLKINNVNLLKIYIDAYSGDTMPEVAEDTWSAIDQSQSINPVFRDKLKKLYSR